jgi:DNA primase large subunit
MNFMYTPLKKLSDAQALEKANSEVSKELAKFDREDVQLQEKKKHKLQKQKKLQKTVQTVFPSCLRDLL